MVRDLLSSLCCRNFFASTRVGLQNFKRPFTHPKHDPIAPLLLLLPLPTPRAGVSIPPHHLLPRGVLLRRPRPLQSSRTQKRRRRRPTCRRMPKAPTHRTYLSNRGRKRKKGRRVDERIPQDKGAPRDGCLVVRRGKPKRKRKRTIKDKAKRGKRRRAGRSPTRRVG